MNNKIISLLILLAVSFWGNAQFYVTNGETITINNFIEISIRGNLVNNGSIEGSGQVTLNGSSNQSITGEGKIAKLTLANSAGFSLNAPLIITDTLAPSNGTLVTNGFLTLQSTENGTGAITKGVGNYLSGNVTVQRYIGNSSRWRMIGFPFTSETNISATALNSFYTSGYNAYTYDETKDDGSYGNTGATNAGWAKFSGGTVSSSKAILLIGGDVTPVINFTGTVNTGTQNIPLSYTPGNAHNGWNFISNPYPAHIDWLSIIANNASQLDNAIYRFDPNTNAYCAFVNGISIGNQSNIVENGGGFFVHSTGATELTIQESDKTTNKPIATLFGFTDLIEQYKSIIRLNLSKEGESSGDEVVLRWGVNPATDKFDGAYDAYDLGRASGADLSVIGNDGTAYAIFHGSSLQTKDKEQREIALGIKGITEGTYTIHSSLLSEMFDNNELYLRDHYTGLTTLISPDQSSYSFQVSSDAGSALSNRFSIVFNDKLIENTAHINLPVVLLNNPSTGNLFTLYSKNTYAQLQWQLIDANGILLQTGSLKNVMPESVHQINAGKTTQGNYFIKLTGDGKVLPVLKALKK